MPQAWCVSAERVRLVLRKRWGSGVAASLVLLSWAVGSGCSGAAKEGPERRTIRLTTGWPGGFFNPLGAALVTTYSKAIPDLSFAVVPSGGADVHGKHLPFLDAAHQVSRGAVDAAFVSAAYPVESVRLATHAGADLLEVSGPVVERLRATYPFLRAVLIPSETYPSLRRAVHTVGIHTVLACNVELDETLVYRLTKTFFAALPELATRVRALRRLDLARAPATPIPLHDGAARYYRERELFR